MCPTMLIGGLDSPLIDIRIFIYMKNKNPLNYEDKIYRHKLLNI